MKKETNNQNNTDAQMGYDTVLPDVFSSDEMLSFGNFIRDNYYGVGAPKLQSYNPVKYPHGTIEEIFVYWCLENDR